MILQRMILTSIVFAHLDVTTRLDVLLVHGMNVFED